MLKEKMNILIHMGDQYPNETPCAKRMRAFYDVFTAEGHTVKVLAPRISDEKHENVFYCPTPPLKKKTTIYRLLNSAGLAVTSFFVAMRTGKADVVITTSPPPLISFSGWAIARMKGAKLVYDVRDIWPDVALEMGSFSPDSIYCKCFRFIRDFMLKHSDLVTAVSPGKVDKLQNYCPTTPVVHIPNGLDEKFLDNQEFLETVKKYFADDVFTCVYVGNLGLAQGLRQLLDVAQKAKEDSIPARFILFGSGAEEKLLRDTAEAQGLDNVVFAGRLPNAEMYTILRHAQMSFVSLVNENLKDSVPTKMYEALGVGCPVLLAAVGDAADILNDCELGIAVRPNDSGALWHAFLKMYETYGNIASHKEHAQQVILEKHSRQKAALLLEKELYKLCNIEETVRG